MADLKSFTIEGSTLVQYKGNDTRVVIPEGVTVIGENAFMFNQTLEAVIIPEGVQEICSGAFAHCELKAISLPSTLKTISNDAFSGTWSIQKANIADLAAKSKNGGSC